MVATSIRARAQSASARDRSRGKGAAMTARIMRLLTALALALTAQAAAARGFIRDAEIERTMALMAAPVLKAAGVPPDSVDIYIINDPQLNAFVAGGRNIFFHTGLLAQMPRPETIMGVIAHETGHITGGHLARRAIAAEDLSGPALLATVLGAAAAAAAGAPDVGAAVLAGGGAAAQRAFLAYSRGEEASADQAAITYMDRAGINPEGLLDILKLFKGQEVFSATRLDPYARSHPLSAARISFLENRIAQSPARGRPTDPEIAYWHNRMRAKLEGFLERPDRVLSRLGADPADDDEFDAYRRAIALHRQSRTDAALAGVATLKRLRPQDPFYHELEGQILFESARPAEAVAAYRRALALAAQEPLIAGSLGRALLATGDPADEAEALRLLRQTQRDDPGEVAILRDLAIAYARAGDDGMAALTTAQRVALTGDPAEAAHLARRAMGLLPEGSPGWLQAEDIAALAPRND